MLRYLGNFFRSNFVQFVLFCLLSVLCVRFYYNKVKSPTNSLFAIEKIVFDGNDKVPDILLLKTSGLRYKFNILNVDLHEIQRKLEGIAWVKSVSVQRKLPNMVYIRVAERLPIAILQSQYKLYLVDADGVVLEHDGIGNYNYLPIVVGDGAAQEAAKFLSVLDKFPKLRKQLVFAVRVGKRRWNMKINRGITIKLPEDNIHYVFNVLDEISDSDGLFNRDIEVIDMRMPDRVVLTKKEG